MRNNFVYPVKAEFGKIICPILITIGLTLIVRAIVLVVTKSDIDELCKQIAETVTEEDKCKECKEFWRKGFVRRLIAFIFMLGLTVFLFYYSVVFCGMYVITQYEWFYSGIWSLLFNWIVFAPLNILLISAIDSAGFSPGCVYYSTKHLFWF